MARITKAAAHQHDILLLAEQIVYQVKRRGYTMDIEEEFNKANEKLNIKLPVPKKMGTASFNLPLTFSGESLPFTDRYELSTQLQTMLADGSLVAMLTGGDTTVSYNGGNFDTYSASINQQWTFPEPFTVDVSRHAFIANPLKAHTDDLQVISDMLYEQAKLNHFCGEFETVIDQWDKVLYAPIPKRPKRVAVHVYVQHTFTVPLPEGAEGDEYVARRTVQNQIDSTMPTWEAAAPLLAEQSEVSTRVYSREVEITSR